MRFTILSFVLFLAVPGVAVAQSEAVIEQVGTGNVSTLIQLTADQGLGSSATIRQENGIGTGGHVALLTQSGGAMAEVFQTGTFNRLLGLDGASAALSLGGSELFVMQSGVGNTAYVDQAGSAYASITQNGTGNTATIIQQ